MPRHTPWHSTPRVRVPGHARRPNVCAAEINKANYFPSSRCLCTYSVSPLFFYLASNFFERQHSALCCCEMILQKNKLVGFVRGLRTKFENVCLATAANTPPAGIEPASPTRLRANSLGPRPRGSLRVAAPLRKPPSVTRNSPLQNRETDPLWNRIRRIGQR